MGEIWAFSENVELLHELLSGAEELSKKLGASSAAVLVGDGVREVAEELGRYGADKVYVVDDPAFSAFSPEAYAEAIAQLAKQFEPSAILVGATKRGKELAPRLAARLDAGCATDCVRLEIDEGGRLVVTRWALGGNIAAEEVFLKKPWVATIPLRVFEKRVFEEKKCEVVESKVSVEKPKAVVVESKKKEAGAPLELARVIVSAGAGVKNREDLKMLEELAQLLDGQVGCSRPLSADYGWFPEWIGLSGKKVKPDAYIACGISGQIQHIAGMRDSKVVIAINSDPNAPIFKVCDYGVVGDLYQVVPALIELLKKRKK